ncbi:hypothetical protein IFR04_010003 [Cadophora malorum]|uniref:Uncharacterized protein n=1 Tax=Cadophora malorum TaxID=108018 RepID=A0A8H7W407_9HELO|nr:hypothetical protein IFR04_010003 [Cadophora malorum]
MLDGYVSDYLLALPPLDATPATVRIYIGQVLQNHHDVSKEEAEAVAAKWLYGRGSELLVYYDIDTFRSIFGAEAGMLLFGYARKELGRTSGAISSTRVGARVGGKVMDKNKKDIFGLTPGFFWPNQRFPGLLDKTVKGVKYEDEVIIWLIGVE